MLKIKRIYKSDKFPIYIYVLIVAIVHIIMTKQRDDLWFSTCCENTNFIDYIINRYQTWSSRIIIETSFVLFCEYLPMWVWKIINIAMYYLLSYSISELFIEKDKRKYNTLMCLLLLLVPINILKSAGWITTMNCYLWVSATALYSLISIKKIYKNEKITIFQGITYILATIYAVNQEQMAGVLFIIYTLSIFYFVKIKKMNFGKTKILIINYIINILWLIIILTCPGNELRSLSEENIWYPGFSNLSIFYKLEIGITAMMNYMVEDLKLIFLTLIVLISYKTYKDNKAKLYKIIGYSPVILTAIYVPIAIFLKNINLMQNHIFIIFKFIIYSLIIISVGLSMITIFDKEKRFLALVIYFCGIISKIIMGFSPTIYASGERTSFFLYISIVIISIMIIKEANEKKEEKAWENSKE